MKQWEGKVIKCHIDNFGSTWLQCGNSEWRCLLELPWYCFCCDYEADEADELTSGRGADELTSRRGQQANEAGNAEVAEAYKANDATADEADVANKPAEAVEAEAYEANDAKADEADEAIVANAIEANVIDKIAAADEVIMIDKIIAVDEAILIDEVIAVDEAILDNSANEAIVANEANDSDDSDAANDADSADEAADAAETTKANEAKWTDEADTAKVDKADDAGAVEASVANEAHVTDEAVASDVGIEADSADEAADAAEITEADKADVANYAIVADDVDGAVLYSLTKYSAIFAEVKGYFGITAPDNQLGRRSLCSLKSKNRYQLDNQLEVVVEKGLIWSSKHWSNNQLGEADLAIDSKIFRLGLANFSFWIWCNNKLWRSAVGVLKIAEINKTNVIVEIVSANMAIAINRAIVIDRANMANEADEASLAEANESLTNGGIAVVVKYSSKLLTLLPFSLTKYFEIFAEVEGYFGLIFNNQLAEMIVVEMGRSSLSKAVCGLEVGILWSSLISLRECLESVQNIPCSLRN